MQNISLSAGYGSIGNLQDATKFRGGALFSLAGVMLHALVDFPLQIASLQLYTMLVAGILWGKGKGSIRQNRA